MKNHVLTLQVIFLPHSSTGSCGLVYMNYEERGCKMFPKIKKK